MPEERSAPDERPTPEERSAPDERSAPHAPASTRSGPGRVLVAVYAVFAVAATSRATVQMLTKFAEAPLAYVLSAFSAVVYIVATVALARGGPTARKVAWCACGVELAGVLTVGFFSLWDPVAFPDATVWSVFGRGYLFVPLVLPILGLAWLRHTGRTAAEPA